MSFSSINLYVNESEHYHVCLLHTKSVSSHCYLVTLYHMSRPVGKPTICIGENKGADQLRGKREADQRLCFRYSDSTILLLLKSEISSFLLFSVTVQPDMCQTCSETTLLVFPRGGSYHCDLPLGDRIYS